ncbi:MAG: glycosyltransferase [Flavobacterium sp.]
MLVSIIIPVHQTHDFFKNCVGSALVQTYGNIEVILACNGNLEIKQCQEYLSKNDSRIVYIKTQNGRHNARNEAIEIAKGDFIQFLDYDDFLFPNKLERQLGIVDGSYWNSVLIISQWKKFHKDINENYVFPFKYLFDESMIDAGQLIQKLAKSRGFLATSSWLISRDLISGVKWIDSPNDDAVFLSEILKKIPDVILIPEILSGYRIHTENTSSIRKKSEFDKLMLSWKLIHQNLVLLGVPELNLYIYNAYLNLIGYSKGINKYRLSEVIRRSVVFGFRAKVGASMFKEIKMKLLK